MHLNTGTLGSKTIQKSVNRGLTAIVISIIIMTSACLQNGFHPKDTFEPVEELRRARAANAGHKLVDVHTKTEAVLDTALKLQPATVHEEEDHCDVSAPSQAS